ncbi:hypothetical protein G5714_012143 [Onychostoma macrolepis]|uniref:AIG1-type G domain-containing protein n=1 Tax=Onychostoma macrolepis TaxID=369639 RepID=A0A7J6CKC8_9TELE|nr:hypothetical protein G5714_012143 [Onychostoma macrolepis]
MEMKTEPAYVRRLEEIRVVLLGWVLAGKSLAGNTILNRDEFAIGGRTREGMRGFGDVDGRKISVLDTPGWWKYIISGRTKENHSAKYVHPGRRRLETHNSFVHVGDRFKDISIEQHIESEGEALQWLIEKCRNRYHVFDNTYKKNRDQVSELLQKIDEMVAENSLFHLNTQKNCEKSCQKTDKQEDLNMEIRLKDVCHFLDEGFKRKAQEIRRNIEKLCMDILEEHLYLQDSFSMDDPPELAQDKPPDSHTPLKAISAPQQDNIPEPIKSLLMKEFSRWESIILDGVQESLQDIKSSFELSQAEKRQSRHFKSDDLIEPSTPTGRRLLKKGAVPTLFEWNNYSTSAPRRTGAWQRREVSPPLNEDPVPVDLQHEEHDYCSFPVPAAVDLSLDQSEDLRKEVEQRWSDTKGSGSQI